MLSEIFGNKPLRDTLSILLDKGYICRQRVDGKYQCCRDSVRIWGNLLTRHEVLVGEDGKVCGLREVGV